MTKIDFKALTPELILDAIESQGFQCSGSLMALNSYENRVYQVGVEDGQGKQSFVIAKFYRPKRWSDAQILEEHLFSKQLLEQEIPVVAPLCNTQTKSLFNFSGYRFALFPRVGGYAPEPGNLEHLERLGALVGRIHLTGKHKSFQHREMFSLQARFFEAKNFLLANEFIPPHLLSSYENIFEELSTKVRKQTADFKNCAMINCHGDWHLGNILWRDDGGHIVDLDDCMLAPAIQDLWMMLSGEPEEQAQQLQAILKGYETFCTFDRSEIKLIESLRSIRIVYYAAWLALRWEDPAFPMNFPWFDTDAYWQQHIRELQEQIDLVESSLLDYF